MTTIEKTAPDAPELLSQLPADHIAAILEYFRDLSEIMAPPPPDMPTTVTEAICRVMVELPGIGKDQTAAPAQGGYAYRGIEAITAAAQHLFGKYGVIFGVPKVIDRKTVDLTINGKPWTEEQLTIVYTVYGPSHRKVREMRVPTYDEQGRVNGVVTIDEVIDDSIEIGPLIGLGRDNVDKGTNKSLTQAYKYALIQTLCIGDSKDDGDGQGEAADARGTQAAGNQAPTADEQCRRLGWESKADMDAAIESFRAMMKDRTEAGKMTREQAVDAWKTYLHPDPEQPDSVFWRTREDHDRFLAGIFGEPAPQAAPEPAETPATGETPPPPPAAAETGAQPAQQAPPPPARTLPTPPPDNGYRGRLDQVFEEKGVDGMIAALKELDVDAVVAELQARGATVEGDTRVSEIRQLLGSTILARHNTGAGEAPASPDQPAAPASAPDTAPAGEKPAQATASRARGRGARSAPDAG